MAAPTLTVFNAGVALGFPAAPNQTGPFYYGAVLAAAASFTLPLGWSVARTPAQPLGWYRITHNLGTTRYAVYGTTRAAANVVVAPTNCLATLFDMNTATLPSGASSDQDFGFLLIVLP